MYFARFLQDHRYRGEVNKTPFKLAAFAVAAIDGLEAVGVRGPYTRTADFQYGGVIDAKGRRWIVKYPLHPIAGAMIEAEVAIAPALLEALRRGLLPSTSCAPQDSPRSRTAASSSTWHPWAANATLTSSTSTPPTNSAGP